MVPGWFQMVPTLEIVILYKASLTFHDGSWMVPDGSVWVSPGGPCGMGLAQASVLTYLFQLLETVA